MRGERHAELRARNYQGAIALERGAADAAEQHFAAALELARTLGDHTTEARCLNNLGIVANLRGDPRAALASYQLDRKSTRLNSSHSQISYAVFCLKTKKI